MRSLLFVAMLGHALLGAPAHHAHGAAVVHCHHAVVHCHDHDVAGPCRGFQAVSALAAVSGPAVAAAGTRIGCNQALLLDQPQPSHAPSGATLSTFSLPQQESRLLDDSDLTAIDWPIIDTVRIRKRHGPVPALCGSLATGCPLSSTPQQWLGRWLA